MNSRKLVNMFFKTLFIGGVVGLITSFFVNASDYMAILRPFDFMELIGLLLFFTGLGLVFSVISQTGFFAYLFIHRFGQNIFRSFWPTVQWLLILFVIFDLIYFPYKGADGKIPLYVFVLMTTLVVIVAFIVARIKVKKTNRTAFVPTLFVMVVITALEWSLVLRAGDLSYMILMLMPLLAANAYQILVLHEVTKLDERQKKRLAERRKRIEKLKKEKQQAKKQKGKKKKS